MLIRAFGCTALAIAVCAAALHFTAPTASAHEFGTKGVTISHPWVRATPKGATVGAAYLEIKTDGKTTDRLLAARSPVAGTVEIHTHIMEGDVMKMRRVEGIDVKAGTSHILKPSGDHVMLMDLKQPLKEGDLLKITLVFAKAGEIEIDATVEPIGAKGPYGMDHQPGHESEHDPKHGGGHKH